MTTPAERTEAMRYGFSIQQDGIQVATVSASNADDAVREALRYMTVYGEDGPVECKADNDQSFQALQSKLTGKP